MYISVIFIGVFWVVDITYVFCGGVGSSYYFGGFWEDILNFIEYERVQVGERVIIGGFVGFGVVWCGGYNIREVSFLMQRGRDFIS